MIQFLCSTPPTGFLSIIVLPQGSVAFNAAFEKDKGCKSAEHLQKWSLCSIISTWHCCPRHCGPSVMTFPRAAVICLLSSCVWWRSELKTSLDEICLANLCTSPSVSTQPLALCPPPKKRALAELRCITLLWCQRDEHEARSTWMQPPSSPVTAGWSPVTVRLLACYAPWAWHCPFQALAMCAPSPSQTEMPSSTWKKPSKRQNSTGRHCRQSVQNVLESILLTEKQEVLFSPSFGHRLMARCLHLPPFAAAFWQWQPQGCWAWMVSTSPWTEWVLVQILCVSALWWDLQVSALNWLLLCLGMCMHM